MLFSVADYSVPGGQRHKVLGDLEQSWRKGLQRVDQCRVCSLGRRSRAAWGPEQPLYRICTTMGCPEEYLGMHMPGQLPRKTWGIIWE